jgi:hypothetical protein
MSPLPCERGLGEIMERLWSASKWMPELIWVRYIEPLQSPFASSHAIGELLEKCRGTACRAPTVFLTVAVGSPDPTEKVKRSKEVTLSTLGGYALQSIYITKRSLTFSFSSAKLEDFIR